MNRTKFRKKLQSDLSFNPFNDKYDLLSIQDFCEKNKPEDNQEHLDRETCLLTVFPNDAYKQLYSRMHEHYQKTHLSFEDILTGLFAVANQDYLIVTRSYEGNCIRDGEIFPEDVFKPSIPISSAANDVLMATPDSVVNVAIDMLNTAINHLRHFKSELKNGTQTERNVNSLTAISDYANLLYILKNSYDEAVWQNGFMSFNQKNQEFNINFPEDTFTLFNKVGFIRVKRNMSASRNSIQSHEKLRQRILSKRKRQRLRRAYLEKGFIQFELEEGEDDAGIKQELIFYSALVVYSPYMTDVKLTKVQNLTLYDLFTLYAECSVLLSCYAQTVKNPEASLQTWENFAPFVPKIRRETLLSYLMKKTIYSHDEISEFISLLSYDSLADGNNRLNLWKTPFVNLGKSLVFPFLPGINGMPYFLLEHWMERGGCSLKDRGKLFERFVRNELRSGIEKKGYYAWISDKQKFKNPQGKTEEIDLLLELKNIVVFAEVKCIKYPFEPRDFNNSFKRLQEASEQITRKTNFIRDHHKQLPELSSTIMAKPFVKVIITNYPFFTGVSIDDVPIVDFYILESYISPGGLYEARIEKNTRTDILKKKYYTNEDEFSDNLSAYLVAPEPVTELIGKFSKEYENLTQGRTEMKIMKQDHVFQEKT